MFSAARTILVCPKFFRVGIGRVQHDFVVFYSFSIIFLTGGAEEGKERSFFSTWTGHFDSVFRRYFFESLKELLGETNGKEI
jgi:hypothetical protein